ADVRLADGSVLSLIDDARLRAVGDAWRLERGAVTVEAVPQQPGHRLTIATAHATVSVVGTVFRVEAGADDTWVSVVHGRVDVAAGSMMRTIDAGQSALADSGGVALMGPQRALALTDGVPSDLFDPVVLIAQSGTFHGLDLARFTYRPSGRATAHFADVAWPVTIAPDERHATVWLRPLSVEPAARMDGTIVAITAGLDDCDYLLAERHVAAGERGWLRLEADLAAGTLNWTRPGAVAQPLRADAIKRLSLRAYCGYIDTVVTVPVIGR
ncbi:MAG: FecR domain-containing protein, partial [Planctomycetes bacterium]|nr:FecR domain-containing protein [Planctomycetota bacterium]